MQDIFIFIQQHLTLSLAFLGVFLLLIILEFIRLKQGASQLEPAQVVEMINHQDATIIDTRSIEAFRQGHIVNAVNCPKSDLDKQTKKIDKYKTKPLIIACANGIDSKLTANGLKEKGFQAYVLAGGISNWSRSGLPLVKG